MSMLLYDACLNGVSIHTLAEEIILRDIVENPADMDIQTSKRSMHPGTRETSSVRRKLEIDHVFVIYTQDSRRRAEIAGLVAAWANEGGWLTVNTRPGVRLFVRPTTMPAQGSALRWQEDITLTLTAFEQPYWEDETDTTRFNRDTVLDEADGLYKTSQVIKPAGNVGKVPVTCFAYNMGENPLTYLKIVVDETMMEFKNMNIEGGGVFGGWFSLDYTPDDILQIKNVRDDNDPSLMRYRTAESSDDLIARCNVKNQIHVYADSMLNITFFARGRWL